MTDPRLALLNWEADEYLAGLVKIEKREGELSIVLSILTEVVLPDDYRDDVRSKVLDLILSRIKFDIDEDMRPVLAERLKQAGW